MFQARTTRRTLFKIYTKAITDVGAYPIDLTDFDDQPEKLHSEYVLPDHRMVENGEGFVDQADTNHRIIEEALTK